MNPKIYVGNWSKAPSHLLTEPPVCLHPIKFAEHYAGMGHDCFTNNPYFVDCAKPEDVFVVLSTGQCVPLLEIPGIAEYRDELDSGELWSLTPSVLQV